MISPLSVSGNLWRTETLNREWSMAWSNQALTPDHIDHLPFVPAQVPGTVALAWQKQQVPPGDLPQNCDAAEYWFRCRFAADLAKSHEELSLEFHGIATLAEVWLNGVSILRSSSMFSRHQVEVTHLIKAENELLLVCRSLTSAAKQKKGMSPRARWRTRVVSEQQLRWFRTTLHGRAPGFSPNAPPIGPWRPIQLVRHCDGTLQAWSRKAQLNGTTGKVELAVRLRVLHPGSIPIGGTFLVGESRIACNWEESGDSYCTSVTLQLPEVRLWWPHTHGEPNLYPVSLQVELTNGSTIDFEDAPIGFRKLASLLPSLNQQFSIVINDTPVFCRGVVWTPMDSVSLATPYEATRERLLLLRHAGFNLIRIPGTAYYETEEFHRLCDELGFLVWQDMVFANFDYPFEDAAFSKLVCEEAESEFRRLSFHCSSAVICGSSEGEQQAGMLGMEASLARGTFFGEVLPKIVTNYLPEALYIPSAPCGGDLPFRTRTGVANYFGVGAYLRPLEDTRRAAVKFASECLAFANIPEPERMEQLALTLPEGLSPTSPGWKRGIPRDQGTGWDFEDVRDHYLKLLYGVDPNALRYADTNRYWDLSRMASGEVMAEVFGEWRRFQSGCMGGIVLWCSDVMPGAGWGILDDRGAPKSVYYFLKRALAPVAIWTTDEGLNGIDIHVANDGDADLQVLVRIALYRAGQIRVEEARLPYVIPQRKTVAWGVEELLGHFVDASYAYRFGPPSHDLVVASLHLPEEEIPFAQTFRFPQNYPVQRIPFSSLEVTAESSILDEQTFIVIVRARCFAWGVRVTASGCISDDAYFGVEPGIGKKVVLCSKGTARLPSTFQVTAMNAEGKITIPLGSAQ